MKKLDLKLILLVVIIVGIMFATSNQQSDLSISGMAKDNSLSVLSLFTGEKIGAFLDNSTNCSNAPPCSGGW
jgi:hypothetical protein